jgi:hypothetical protein
MGHSGGEGRLLLGQIHSVGAQGGQTADRYKDNPISGVSRILGQPHRP